RSGSLARVFPDVKVAAGAFVSYFDPSSDRIALITFSSGVTVTDSMSESRGFDVAAIQNHIAAANAGGPTSTAEALYQAWDQLRSVPSDSQSALRVIVLLTDGSPNAFPAVFPNVANSFADCSSPPTSSTARQTVAGTICS